MRPRHVVVGVEIAGDPAAAAAQAESEAASAARGGGSRAASRARGDGRGHPAQGGGERDEVARIGAPLHEPARPASIEVPPSPAAAPAQHGCPGAPHATQVPAEHVVPEARQIVRAPLGAVGTVGQHAAPMVPQGPASGRRTSVGLSMAHADSSTAVSTAKPNEMDLITEDDNRPPRVQRSLWGRGIVAVMFW